MTKAILVIDDIPDDYKDYQLKATFTLWKIQNGVLKEIGIHGCDFLKEMPKKKVPVFNPNDCDINEEIKIIHEIDGYNACIDEIIGEDND